MVNAKKLFSSVKNMRHFLHLFSHSTIRVTLRLIKQFNGFDHLYPNFKWINEKYIIDSNLIDNTINIILLPSCIDSLSHLLKIHQCNMWKKYFFALKYLHNSASNQNCQECFHGQRTSTVTSVFIAAAISSVHKMSYEFI